jgi:hypothetical protein
VLEGYELKQQNNALVIREKGSAASKMVRDFLIRKYRGSRLRGDNVFITI